MHDAINTVGATDNSSARYNAIVPRLITDIARRFVSYSVSALWNNMTAEFYYVTVIANFVSRDS